MCIVCEVSKNLLLQLSINYSPTQADFEQLERINQMVAQMQDVTQLQKMHDKLLTKMENPKSEKEKYAYVTFEYILGYYIFMNDPQ